MTATERRVHFPILERDGPGGCEVFEVPGPDRMREQAIPLLGLGRKIMAKRFGAVPSRSSIYRWRMDGYPLDRDGPRVRLPAYRHVKRLYTSEQALYRWFSMIQQLGDEIREAGSVAAWRERRNG